MILNLLKLKCRYDSVLFNTFVKFLLLHLDFITYKVLDSLKAGNESLKEVHKLFSIEDIEMIMEETREGIDKQKVIIHIYDSHLSNF